jgi:hypothetical protein
MYTAQAVDIHAGVPMYATSGPLAAAEGRMSQVTGRKGRDPAWVAAAGVKDPRDFKDSKDEKSRSLESLPSLGP